MSETRILAEPLLARAVQNELTMAELEEIRRQLDQAQSQLQVELEESSRGLQELEGQLSDAVADAFCLLHYGLDELRNYLLQGQAGQLRLARLLFEKGEEEYLSLRGRLKRIEMQTTSSDLPGGLWARVLEQVGREEEDVSWAESEFSAHLQLFEVAFREALKCLTGEPSEAERQIQLLQLRLTTVL